MSLEHELTDVVRAAVAAELQPLIDRIDRIDADRRVMSVKDAAAELGVSDRTVRRMVADGSLPTLDLGPGRPARIPGWALEQARPRRHLRSAP